MGGWSCGCRKAIASVAYMAFIMHMMPRRTEGHVRDRHDGYVRLYAPNVRLLCLRRMQRRVGVSPRWWDGSGEEEQGQAMMRQARANADR